MIAREIAPFTRVLPRVSPWAFLMQAVHGVEGVLEHPAPEVLIYEFGASSVDLHTRWWIPPPRRRDALDFRELTAIERSLLEHGVDLPFPTQHVHFHDQTEESDGDRARQGEGWSAGEGFQLHASAPCGSWTPRAINSS